MKRIDSRRSTWMASSLRQGVATSVLAAWLCLAAAGEALGQANTLFRWGAGDGGDTKNAAEKLAEPLVTDRPDFTEASSTVGLGVFQIEAGYTYSYDANAASSTANHSYPESLFRYGIFAEWLEARVAWNYAAVGQTEFGGNRTDGTGAEPLYLGFKVALTGQEGLLPEMALLPQMTVPTGPTEFGGDETLPGLGWLYGWDVNEVISTGGETQANRALDGADVDHTQNYFNAGTTFLVNDNLQLDIRYGVGLNEAADDYFAGSGFAWRL
ncbi:transporter [Lacipirellula limnantheis]|uniref:Transporter n=1 Tax=Lacipirellula limnantheis TaxID=2528024 RepID=A0A517TZJ0_9BACT|nr:transporter [Lacipirellula limnantheis]QDT73782.1 hypothetical protein I41_29730 [Lacipirellula limnantheis]